MEFSRCLTVRDVELINQAIQRKFEYYNTQLRGFQTRDKYLLSTEEFNTFPFFLYSSHDPIENANGKRILTYHDADIHILKRDLDSYLKFVYHQAERIPWKTYGRSSRVSTCNSFIRMLCFEDYESEFSSLMKKMMKKILPCQRIYWVISLLLTFHYGDECSKFVSTAMKLFLNVFQFFPLSFYAEHASDYEKYYGLSTGCIALNLQRYVKIIQRNRCSEDIMATAIETFYFHPNMNKFFLKWVPDIHYILETAQKSKLGQPKFLYYHEPGRLKSSDICVILDPQNFASLVKFGAPNIYSREDRDIMKLRGMDANEFHLLNENSVVLAYDYFSLRLNQVVHLFEKSDLNERHRKEAEFVLKLLWESIPDPYISLQEVQDYVNAPITIMKSSTCVQNGDRLQGFCLNLAPKDHSSPEFSDRATIEMAERGYEIHRTRSSADIFSCWLIKLALGWYKKVLSIENIKLKTPRSLLHLSKCAVRRSLAANFQLPRGVHLLNLPTRVQNYLLMTDCGSNPYEEECHVANTLERLHKNEV